MANTIELLIRLERRLFVIEKALGITPDIGDLTHSKAVRQAKQLQLSREAAKQLEEKLP